MGPVDTVAKASKHTGASYPGDARVDAQEHMLLQASPPREQPAVAIALTMLPKITYHQKATKALHELHKPTHTHTVTKVFGN